MCDPASTSSPFAPEDCFTVSFSELTSFPYDPVFVGVSRASALLRLLMDSSNGLAENGAFSVSHADVMNNLWLLQLCLRQVEDVLEAWVSQEVEHG